MQRTGCLCRGSNTFSSVADSGCHNTCRTPIGVRGLKFNDQRALSRSGKSHPHRGAWIEISGQATPDTQTCVAPPTGCVD